MEEVWKDINLNDHITTTTDNAASASSAGVSFRGMFFQQFLPHKESSPPCASAESTIFSSPATVLSLNSGHDFQYLENPERSSADFPDFSRKRVSENDDEDPRYVRMMKNRDAAARSRARRQAYTNELVLEVAHLMEENKKLKKQQHMMQVLAVPAVKVPKKKNTLARTLTSPF